MKAPCDCIIPFFNEGSKVLCVVESILKVKNIYRIIVIDDGSNDKTSYLTLKTKFPQVVSIRLKINQGKANAVKEGLKYVKNNYIILLMGI